MQEQRVLIYAMIPLTVGIIPFNHTPPIQMTVEFVWTNMNSVCLLKGFVNMVGRIMFTESSPCWRG